jgi:hypothetical protein
MAEKIPLDNRPWIPRSLPTWLMKELTRRKSDFGINYISNTQSGWDENGSWNQYKGPMTPWVRVCSNGTGVNKFLKPFANNPKRDGFVFYGGQGFKDTFGIPDNKTILGYDVYGNPHYVPTAGSGFNYKTNVEGNTQTVQPFLPAPGIESVEATLQKQMIRNVVIKWHCYGFAQLEYMTPYFLTPGISTIVEFGWNHFNQNSLLNLDINKKSVYMVLDQQGNEIPYTYQESGSAAITNLSLKDLWKDGTPLYDSNVRISRGMYDVVYGSIINFEFSTTDGVKFDCSTTVASKHRNFGGVQYNNPNTQTNSDGKNGNTQGSKSQTMTFPQFVEKRLKKVKNCLKKNLNFLDALDDQEKELFKNIDAKNQFYNGKAENRMFFGRTSDVDNTNHISGNAWIASPEDGDWDYKEHEKVWVTMGFLSDLFNFFFTKTSGINDSNNNPFQFYKVNISDTVLSAHPNLISTDGDVCLIPNAQAPKYNNGYWYKLTQVINGKISVDPKAKPIDKYDQQTLTANSKIFAYSFNKINNSILNSSSLADKALYNTFKTGQNNGNSQSQGYGIARDDLDSILNRFIYNSIPATSEPVSNNIGVYISPSVNGVPVQNGYTTIYNENRIPPAPLPTPEKKGTHSFPRYDVNYSSPTLGTSDSKDTKKSKYYGYLEDIFINTDFIIKIVKECSTTGEFYDKLLQGLNNAVNGFWDLKTIEDNKTIRIIDNKYFPIENFSTSPGVYQFDLSSGNNIVKNLSFTSTISDIQANQTIAASSNNKGNGELSTTQPSLFVFGDRLGNTENTGSSKKLSIPNSDIIKQLQTPANNPERYTMSFRIPGSSNVSTLKKATIYAGEAAVVAGTVFVGGIATIGTGGVAAAALAGSLGAEYTAFRVLNSTLNNNDALNVVNLTLPDKSLLTALLNDEDYVNNTSVYGGQQPGFTLEFTLQGIAGFQTFQVISFKNFPRPYSDKDVLFSIIDVNHTLSNNNWETRIKAQIRPIRNYETLKILYTEDGINTYMSAPSSQGQ